MLHVLYLSPQCVHVAASFLASLSLLFGVCVCVCVCVSALCSYMFPQSDEATGRGHSDCRPGLWMHHWPPIITFTKSSSKCMFEPAGHRSADNYTVERGKKRKKKKKTFQREREKLTLKMTNGTLCSVRRFQAFVTAPSLPSFCYGFCSRLEMPRHWPRIHSALITDCGCMLINDCCSKRYK